MDEILCDPCMRENEKDYDLDAAKFVTQRLTRKERIPLFHYEGLEYQHEKDKPVPRRSKCRARVRLEHNATENENKTHKF